MKLNKNDIFVCDITGATHDGYGVARVDGMAVFVPGAAVGDQAEVRIVKLLSNRAIGKLERLIIPSKDRIENDCPAFPACGGCNYRHISYEAESALKAEQIRTTIEKLGGVECANFEYFPAPSTSEYRNKAVFPVAKDRDCKTVFGFYRANSHRLIPCSGCRIHPPVFTAAAEAVCRYMDDNGVEPYDEETRTGIVRSIFVRQGAVSGEIMVCVNAAKRRLKNSDVLIMYLKAVCPKLTSVMLSWEPEVTNRVMGERVFLLWGKPVITDTLAGNVLTLSAHSFYQVNHAQCERLYARIVEDVASCGDTETMNVLDLFCGAGSITLALARRCRNAVGIESVPDAVDNAKENAARNGLEHVRFVCADAATSPEILGEMGFQPDIIVVDPPRKGLSEGVTEYLIRSGVKNVVYVSCDPATLARDIGRLRSGGFTLRHAAGFDLFPRTANVETVCLLMREKCQQYV